MGLINKLTTLADAVRQKTYSTAQMTLDEMTNKILNIPEISTLIGGSIIEYSDDVSKRTNSYAFFSCQSLKKIKLTNAKYIAQHSFDTCLDLEEVEIPNVEGIGNHSFYYCEKLKYLDLQNVNSIEQFAFSDCSLLSTVVLRYNGIVRIRSGAFDRTPIKSGNGYIYVPDNIYNIYKSDSWEVGSAYENIANWVKPISELGGTII